MPRASRHGALPEVELGGGVSDLSTGAIRPADLGRRHPRRARCGPAGPSMASPGGDGSGGATPEADRPHQRPFLIGVSGGTASGKVRARRLAGRRPARAGRGGPGPAGSVRGPEPGVPSVPQSTVCEKIMELLGQNEVDHRQRKVVILSQDRFYQVLTAEQKAKALKGQYNFDHPGRGARGAGGGRPGTGSRSAECSPCDTEVEWALGPGGSQPAGGAFARPIVHCGLSLPTAWGTVPERPAGGGRAQSPETLFPGWSGARGTGGSWRGEEGHGQRRLTPGYILSGHRSLGSGTAWGQQGQGHQ